MRVGGLCLLKLLVLGFCCPPEFNTETFLEEQLLFINMGGGRRYRKLSEDQNGGELLIIDIYGRWMEV